MLDCGVRQGFVAVPEAVVLPGVAVAEGAVVVPGIASPLVDGLGAVVPGVVVQGEVPVVVLGVVPGAGVPLDGRDELPVALEVVLDSGVAVLEGAVLGVVALGEAVPGAVVPGVVVVVVVEFVVLVLVLGGIVLELVLGVAVCADGVAVWVPVSGIGVVLLPVCPVELVFEPVLVPVCCGSRLAAIRPALA